MFHRIVFFPVVIECISIFLPLDVCPYELFMIDFFNVKMQNGSKEKKTFLNSDLLDLIKLAQSYVEFSCVSKSAILN